MSCASPEIATSEPHHLSERQMMFSQIHPPNHSPKSHHPTMGNGRDQKMGEEALNGDSLYVSNSEEGEQSLPVHSQSDSAECKHHDDLPMKHHPRSGARTTPEPLPENQLRGNHSRRKSHHRHRSRHRRSGSHRKRSSEREDKGSRGEDVNMKHQPSSGPSSIASDDSGKIHHVDDSHSHERNHDSYSKRRRRNTSSGRQEDRDYENGEYVVHENRHYVNDTSADDDSDTERSDFSPDQVGESESSCASSTLPAVFWMSGVGGTAADDFSEITNVFAFKKSLEVKDFNDTDDETTIDGTYYWWRLPKSWFTIIVLIGAVIVVSVVTTLLIVVGINQDLDGPKSRVRYKPENKGAKNTPIVDPSFPTTSPTPASNETFIRSIIEPPSLAECKSIASGKDYYGPLLTNGLMEAYFAVDMDVRIRDQVAYGDNNFVKFVQPEIEIAIQNKLLPLLVGCKEDDEWTRRRRRLVTEYPILNAKVIKLYKQDGHCVQNPVSCYKISFETKLTFIEMGPPGPIVAKITQLFTKQTIVQRLGLDFVIKGTDTTDVRKLEPPPSIPPSPAPSEVPSARPSSKISATPTLAPAVASPTRQYSKKPSGVPKEASSAVPTRFPTILPSREPTPLPTGAPSPAPTLTASHGPTRIPSV